MRMETNAHQLTHLSAYAAGYPHWSPDGQFIAFHARFPAEPQLYILRISDGVVRKVTSSKPGFAGSIMVPRWQDALRMRPSQRGNSNLFCASERRSSQGTLERRGGD